jgi:acyl-CoA thioester hydrolase
MARRFVSHCPLRWSDMDAFQHVNNVAYLRYLEEARVHWMFNHATTAGTDSFAAGTVVVRHEIDYKRPLTYRPEPIVVETWVTRIGNASFDVSYEVKDEEHVYATAASVLVPYDVAAGRPRRISDAERSYLEGYLVA